MAQLRSTDISELDFDQIKSNLKLFLENQTEFTDYDFEGSGLSVLLDVLAYNTHYNAYLANMLANEMFLDSAVKRSSAVSIAKHLGYTPLSTRSARALVDITVNNPTGTPSTLTLNAKTPFNASIAGNSYTFYNLEASTILPSNDTYTFEDIELVEGSLASLTFPVANPGPSEKFELPDNNVDTSTLKVTVQTSFSNTTSELYVLSNNISNVTPTSKVYFLDENPSGKFELYFGDGVFGKKLTNGNLVKVEYLRSSGVEVNTSNNITTSFTTTSIGGSSSVNITVNTNPIGAKTKDTITDIKFKAPRVNSAKNRAVTSTDYENLILSNFTEAESVSVWGGEDNDPPYYGKVLISLKPFDGFTISQSTKQAIIADILSDKKILAIQPEFIDPDYYYVNIISNITYDSLLTTKTSSEIRNIVTTTIQNYFATDLQKFNKDFNKSKLIKLILESDTSIVSVIITLRLQKRFFLNLNSQNSFREETAIRFRNAIHPGTLSSSRFYVTSANTLTLAKITDIPNTMPPSNTGTGTLTLLNVDTNLIIDTSVGTVNYGTGVVTIDNILPTALPSGINDFRLTASVQEESHNIQVYRNEILVLDNTILNSTAGRETGLTVNVTAA